MKTKLFFVLIITLSVFLSNELIAQEEENDNPSKFTTGADFYSSFIWRGTKFGTGPAFQPYVEFAAGGLTIGSWGSFDASGYMESDLYANYGFDFGLNLGATDYYFPELDLTDFSDSTGSHALELTLGYEIKGFSLSANCVVNEAGGAGSTGGDLYFQAAYAFTNVGIFLGAGNGWHTSDAEFAICNIGIETTKTINITDRFSVDVTGQVVLNPDKKNLFVVVGISL